MANTDVLDILSDTLTPPNRGSANKDEIIREKVKILFEYEHELFFFCYVFFLEKRSKEKYSSTRRYET